MQFWPQDGTTIIGSLHVVADLTVINEETLTAQVSNLLRERVPCLKQLTVQVEDMNLQDCSCRGESTDVTGSALAATTTTRRTGYKEKD